MKCDTYPVAMPACPSVCVCGEEVRGEKIGLYNFCGMEYSAHFSKGDKFIDQKWLFIVWLQHF